MRNYKLVIQYDGGRYKGWQRLGNNDNTIQGKIESVLSELVGKRTEIVGSSRTDAGVHAIEQVANFETSKALTETEIQDYLQRYLPHDISIKEVSIAPQRFHARYHVKSKTYLYKIWNKRYPNPFMRKYSLHVIDELDVAAMMQAAEHFIGEHDFTTFTNAKSKKKSMVRHITAIHFEEKDGFIFVRIEGNGFLHNMVRKIVATLIEAGLGKVAASDIKEMLAAKERKQINYIAAANGLYLESIKY